MLRQRVEWSAEARWLNTFTDAPLDHDVYENRTRRHVSYGIVDGFDADAFAPRRSSAGAAGLE